MKTVGNCRKTPQLFFISTFEYENQSENGKAEHENERELTENRVFRKQTNSSGIMSKNGQYMKNKYGIPPHSTKCITITKCMTLGLKY
jgi:hypothetical protein